MTSRRIGLNLIFSSSCQSVGEIKHILFKPSDRVWPRLLTSSFTSQRPTGVSYHTYRKMTCSNNVYTLIIGLDRLVDVYKKLHVTNSHSCASVEPLEPLEPEQISLKRFLREIFHHTRRNATDLSRASQINSVFGLCR